MHFALNCGARSCPPIKIYDGSNLQAGLALAAAAFLEADLAVDAAARRVTLSKLLLWYGGDFGATPLLVLSRLAGMLPPDHPTARELAALLRDGGAPVEIEYREYDWAMNAA